MSPLKINALLCMKALPQPFASLPDRQARAPAMVEAFHYFEQHGLLAEGVDLRVVLGANGMFRPEFLSEKGQRLVAALCAIQPEDVP